MLSTFPSLVAAVIAAVLTLTPPRLTPTERARVVIRHAHLAGTGAPITRADILAELAAERAPSLMTRGFPDGKPAVTPDPTPDAPVSFAAAAARLGVSVATVKRYAAPSSGKLVRLGDGVGQASLEACAATR